MKIAVSAEQPNMESPVDTRFGRAKYFVVIDTTDEKWDVINNEQNLQAAQGAGIQSAANVVNAGCGVLISGHCGPKAFAALSKAGVKVYSVKGGTVKDTFTSYKNGNLTELENADVEGHW